MLKDSEQMTSAPFTKDAQFRQEIESWIGERVLNGSDIISLAENNPDARPEQRIEESLTHYSDFLLGDDLSNNEACEAIERLLGIGLGTEGAKNLIEQFREPGQGGKPKAEFMLEKLRQGKNIGLITPHSHYVDIAMATAAATAAMGEREQIKNNNLIINKAFTHLNFYGLNMTEQLRSFTSIIWFVPEEGANRHGIDDELTSEINRRGIGEYIAKLRKGGQLIGYAPTGTGIDKSNPAYLGIKPISESSAGLLSKLDGIYTITVVEDGQGAHKTAVSDYIELRNEAKRHYSKAERQGLGKAIGRQLCFQLADVSGLPVKNLNGSSRQ